MHRICCMPYNSGHPICRWPYACSQFSVAALGIAKCTLFLLCPQSYQNYYRKVQSCSTQFSGYIYYSRGPAWISPLFQIPRTNSYNPCGWPLIWYILLYHLLSTLQGIGCSPTLGFLWIAHTLCLYSRFIGICLPCTQVQLVKSFCISIFSFGSVMYGHVLHQHIYLPWHHLHKGDAMESTYKV